MSFFTAPDSCHSPSASSASSSVSAVSVFVVAAGRARRPRPRRRRSRRSASARSRSGCPVSGSSVSGRTISSSGGARPGRAGRGSPCAARPAAGVALVAVLGDQHDRPGRVPERHAVGDPQVRLGRRDAVQVADDRDGAVLLLGDPPELREHLADVLILVRVELRSRSTATTGSMTTSRARHSRTRA